jgi:V8-like Glu-specific endopeptidase
MWESLCLAQGIGTKQFPLSDGKAVPVGELEAVGTIPGCTATVITNNLLLTAAHCVCPHDIKVDIKKM